MPETISPYEATAGTVESGQTPKVDVSTASNEEVKSAGSAVPVTARTPDEPPLTTTEYEEPSTRGAAGSIVTVLLAGS